MLWLAASTALFARVPIAVQFLSGLQSMLPDAAERLSTYLFVQAARLQVLQGTFLLFSGVIPLQQSPQEHPLWKMAVKFGARCTIDKHEDVTHVVAKSSLTEKVGCENRVMHQAAPNRTEQASQACGGGVVDGHSSSL